AQHAWECAKKAQIALGKDGYEKYVKLAKGLPALIMNSGVMQVTAFLHEKSLDSKTKQPKLNDHHTWVGDHFRAALNKKFPSIPADFSGFMGYMMKASPQDYQAINAEAFAWLKWLRQLAAARQGQDS